MKISKQQLKELVKQVVREEDSEYQVFFQKALEKTGKSIPDMSDEEKKDFFNKIDAAWDGKGEKNESVNENLRSGDVSKLQKGLEHILGTNVNYDINSNDAYEFYIDNAEFYIGVGDGEELGTKFAFDIYNDGATKTLANGTSDNLNDIIKQVLAAARKHKKSLLLKNESVNEANYSNQTGIKSSLVKNNEFSSLLNPKEIKWIKGSDVKIFKGIGMNFSFTDGKSEMIVNINKPMSIVKKLGKVGNDVKKVYQQNESVNKQPLKEGKLGQTWNKNNKKGYTLKVGNLQLKSQGPGGVHQIFKDGKMWGTFLLDTEAGGSDWWVKPRSGKNFYADEIDDIVKRINSSNESVKEQPLKEEEIRKGSVVVVMYPTLKKPITGKVMQVLKSAVGTVYVLDDNKGVWDAKYVTASVPPRENKEPLKEGVTGYKLLLNVSAGYTDRIEGIKVSKQMADTILDWMRTSPYGKKYGKQLQKVPFGSILKPVVGPFGIKKRMSSDLNGEFKRLAAHVENDTIA